MDYELVLIIKQDGLQYIVVDDFPATHGTGPTVRAALDDYLLALHGHWRDLRANEERLSPRLAKQLAYLDMLFDLPDDWFEEGDE